MSDAGERFWPRTAPLGALAMLAVAAVHPGCSCSDDTEPPGTTTTTTTTPTTTTTSSGGGMGGEGGEGGAGGTGGAAQAYEVAEIAGALAFDATPNPSGATVYFTGISGNGQIGVFKKNANGTGDVTPVAVGAPFVAPFGIASSSDGLLLYVADLGADDVATGTDAGRIFKVTATGGIVTPVSGGDAVLARGLEVHRDAQGGDRIVFSGVDAADGQPGVFDLPASGGAPTALAKGIPLADPSGVAIASSGEVYVCDTLSRADKTAAIFTISRGVVNELATGLHVGFPCGIALSRDEATLLVLARGPVTGTDEVLVIDVATQAVTKVTAGLDGYSEPGGLHRAKDADVFAFVDGKAQGTGLVFLMTK